MRTTPTKRFVPRALALAGILVIASSCSGDKTAAPNSAEPSAVANIPGAGSVAVKAPPQLPPRGASLPTEGTPLADLYAQGKVDVLR